MSRLSCACGREVPVIAVWTALSKALPLRCSACRSTITRTSLFDDADDAGDHPQAVLAAYAQLVSFGKTSHAAIMNAIRADADPRVVAGLLAGLMRAGLIEKAQAQPDNVEQLVSADQSPVYIPGPLFPHVEATDAAP